MQDRSVLPSRENCRRREGVLVSLNEGDLNAYSVVLDSQGKEKSREKLKPGPTGRTDPLTYMFLGQ